MSGAIPLLPLYPFMVWTGKSLPFPKFFNVGTHIFLNEAVSCLIVRYNVLVLLNCICETPSIMTVQMITKRNN